MGVYYIIKKLHTHMSIAREKIAANFDGYVKTSLERDRVIECYFGNTSEYASTGWKM